MATKVSPGPHELLLHEPPTARTRGPTLTAPPGHAPHSSPGRLHRLLLRLPWTTRHALPAAAHLLLLLYLFLSVPFRLAFYYDPHAARDGDTVDLWTRELTVFALADGLSDVVGFVQFFSFYRTWKRAAGQVESSENATEPSRDKAAVLTRNASFRERRGKTKWTIATINGVSSGTQGAVEKFIRQRKKAVEFILEVVAIVPVEIIPVALGAFNALHLVRVTKLCRLYRLRRHLSRIADIYSDRAWVQHLSSTGVDSLVRTIGLCAGMCHWAACGYMLIAHVQCGLNLEACDEHVETSWVVRDRLFGASTARKYGRTLYWSARTLVLLGCDDVTPVSDAETLYVIFVILLGALFGSSMLANFLFLFRIRNARYAAYSAHVDNAREYMRLQNIPLSVRHQVTAYFNYAWNAHHSLDSEEALQLMPKHLQSKVVSTLKTSRIKQISFLTKESVEFTNMLALALARRIYSPGNQILEPKINAEAFFVIRGTVILSAFDGSKPNNCQAGEFFADTCLLFPEQYEQQAVAKTFCELYVLAKTKFDVALAEYYRGNEAAARFRMTEILEKNSMQLEKMKKLLGLRGAHQSGSRKGSMGGSSHSLDYRNLRHGVNWRLPGSSFSVYWDSARLAAIVYVTFEVPYFAVFISMLDGKHIFTVQPEFESRYILTLLIEVLFGVDLLLRSRYFAYLEPTVMFHIVDPSLIFAAYKKKGFHLDFLAWLPVGLLLDSLPFETIQGYSSLFRLLRLMRMRWIPTLIHELSDFYGTSSKRRLILSLLLGVTLMLHFVGCLWFEMTLFSQDINPNVDLSSVMSDLTRPECLQQATQYQNCSWVKFDCYSHIGTVFPHENADSTYQASFAYLRSVYWAVVTLTAVGYGDIVAYTTAESYFAALWIFVGGIINFGVVGAMSSTISNMLAVHHHHMEKLNTLNTILERMEISDKLSAEIRRFYHRQFTGRKQAYESKLLSHLPDQLCYEISSLLHSDAVKSVALFDSASTGFLKDVTGKFRNRSYQNGDTICLEGDVCREFFVLLQGSKINVFFRSRKVPIRALHGGDSYCVNEFLLRRPYPATLSAASVVHASVMARDQFDVIQRKFSDDLNAMKAEAETLWTQDQHVLTRITGNLEKMKLQTHSMHTPTLFYQRESAITPTNKNRQTMFGVSALRNQFNVSWPTIISLWNVYNVLFIVFRIGFHSHLHFSSSLHIAVWLADLCCDACFAIDIYFSLMDNSHIGLENLENRKRINFHYLRSSAFKWDIAASLPLYAPVSSGSLTASLCRLPRLVRSVDLWHYLDDTIVQIQQRFATHNVSAYLSPAKLMIILVFVAHFVGCIFVLISEYECHHVERCWMKHDHLLHQYHDAVPILYAKSFYWAITTLLLVGSRESVPRDTVGTLWTGFTCLLCTFIIGYIVGEISELILELGKETKQYKHHIAGFERFAKDHELSSVLRDRVGFFFREQFNHTKGTDLQTVHDLSANLRLKLMLEVYGHAIANLPICRFLTSSQVNNLVLRLRSELFIPGDNILSEGSYGNRLCTLRKGLAAVYWTKSVSSISALMEGAFFGEIAFFLPNQRRLATVRATTFCEVLYVSKHDWQELWTTSGNASDNQIQKHALHAILDWVSSRLRRYQRASLRIAKRAKRLLNEGDTSDATSPGEVRRASALSSFLKTNNNGTTRTAIPSHKSLKTDLRGVFVSPEAQLLEMKALYILLKTDECAKKFSPAITMMQKHKSSMLATIRSSLRNSVLSSFQTTPRSGANSTGGLWHSSNADSSLLAGKGRKEADIRLLQFIVELNPINKHVRGSLGKAGLISMEEECWARRRLLTQAQHAISRLLDAFLPSESELVTRRPRINTPSGRKGLRRSFSSRSRTARVKSRLESLDMGAPSTIRKVAESTKKDAVTIAIVSGKKANGSSTRRRHSVTGPNEQPSIAPASNTKLTAKLVEMTRSCSLPVINTGFFGDGPHCVLYHLKKGGVGIDFEIIQRCQMPQYVTQLHWYHRYRQWRGTVKPVVGPGGPMLPISDPVQARNNKGHLTRDMQMPTFRRIGRPRVAAMGSSLQLPSERTLLSATTDLQSKQFIHRVKQAGKLWDFMMLTVAIYHLLVTPFKVSFARALVELPIELLRKWSALEMVFDVFCLVDAASQVRHASMMQQGVISVAEHSSANRLRRIFHSNPELRVYIVGLLPLELLLFSARFRVSTSHSAGLAIDSSWWVARWLLRMNRMLIIRRIEPLSEQLFQYVIHDLKLSVSEAFLYFLRGLSAYLATGHILACIWFFTSEVGFHYYGASWLSTSGMLTYISNEASVAEHTSRLLSEGGATFYLTSVSLTRKYFRSLLFSLECISTLFYGDILSMNTLELVAEIIITLWAIYIYGALVGAQAELLDSRARREASFEQSLGELQHYVVQNEVPKTLKRQIKAYYGRIWRRSQGEHEFAAVSSVSRVLYEDVVLTTLGHFVAQVKIFSSLDENFLRGLLVCLQYVVCSENEQVFVIGDVDRSMYFIDQGRMLVQTDMSEFTRERGEYFGELTLLYGISRLETCIALTLVELYRLDHEPYERLLLEFPEYRSRNKVAWTTLGASDRLGSELPHRPHTPLASRPSIARVTATTAINVDARLQHSFVHKAAMKMLAGMKTLHPLEAKDLILKCREGARRHLMRSGINTPEDGRTQNSSEEAQRVDSRV